MIFPEGGNFTPQRRQRGIESAAQAGHGADGEPGGGDDARAGPAARGFLAALDAAPDADVVLVAHTGLDHLLTVRDLWRELPMDKQIVMQWWQVPRSEIPEGREARIDWLFGWWEQIDAWIEQNRPKDLSSGRHR